MYASGKQEQIVSADYGDKYGKRYSKIIRPTAASSEREGGLAKTILIMQTI